MTSELPSTNNQALAERLRKIAHGEWVLAGDEGYLLIAADLLESCAQAQRDEDVRLLRSAGSLEQSTWDRRGFAADWLAAQPLSGAV